MKIKKVKLKNFRCYYEETEISIDDLTVFVGENDSGKSAILEALDIFFNEGEGVAKFESNDRSIRAAEDEEVIISVAFSFPETGKIVIDKTVQVSPKEEYLLNKEGYLEIMKVFKDKPKPNEIYLRCYYPANDDFLKDLLRKKIDELRKFTDEKGIHCEDRRKASELRRAIINWYGEKEELRKEEISIRINEEGLKEIWPCIKNYLPSYNLFKVDRTNLDENEEIQDPLKSEIQRVIKTEQISKQLKDVEKEILEACRSKADRTLQKLQIINPQIAAALQPQIPSELKWEAVFKQISLISDEGIPFNKRGSGVRRLILLCSLLAEAEESRRKSEEDHQKASNPTIVYAIEEPETSLHPDWQKKLVEAVSTLVERGDIQILLTTHSPPLAQLFPRASLRLVRVDSHSRQSTVQSGKESERIYHDIAANLGVIPWLGKLAICVEGEMDREFLLSINQAIPELREIVELSDKPGSPVVIIPLQGSNLKHWVEREYLKNTNVLEFHLYDKDEESKYKEYIEKIRKRGDGSDGVLTSKREIENYVHWKLIEKRFEIHFTDEEKKKWDELDIPRTVLDKCQRKYEDKQVKRIICGELAKKMTKQLLEELNGWHEVKSWFEKIKEMYDNLLQKP